MVRQEEIDSIKREMLTQKKTIDELSKIVTTLEKQNKEKGKALYKLWEKRKELVKEIVILKKYCGKLTYDVSVLHLENIIIVPPAARQIGCPGKQFLVKDILMQLINESHSLEFNVLQKKESLTVTSKILK